MMCQFYEREWEREWKRTLFPPSVDFFNLEGSKILRLLKIDQMKNEEQSSWWSWYVLGKESGANKSQEKGGRSLFSQTTFMPIMLFLFITEKRKKMKNEEDSWRGWFMIQEAFWANQLKVPLTYKSCFFRLVSLSLRSSQLLSCSLQSVFFFMIIVIHSQFKGNQAKQEKEHDINRKEWSQSFWISLKHKFVSREKSVYLLFSFMYGFVTLTSCSCTLFSTVVFFKWHTEAWICILNSLIPLS